MKDRYSADSGYTVRAYFELVASGALTDEDHVELLDGVIVAEPPMDPPHATAIDLAGDALRGALGERAWVREQKPLVAGERSVPEPDLAVVPGGRRDYETSHPITALLVVEVSHSSLPQDRLSKSRIYAGAGIPEYWIVNLREDCVEVYRSPDVAHRLYAARHIAGRGERIALVAFPDTGIAVDALLPGTPALPGRG